MTEEFLSLTEVARHLGVTHGTLTRRRLPEPDARIGATRGWRVETIDEWNSLRPGRGRWRASREQAEAPEGSASRRESAITTTDREGNSAYVWVDGHHVVHDGYGRMAWSLYRPDDRDGSLPSYFTTTLTDAIANI